MTYDDLVSEVATRFPDLAPRVARERAIWNPDPIGGDILLADIFVPFFVQALRALPASADVVGDASAFVEELATSDETALRQAARISVLQALEDYPRELPAWTASLGPTARSMLPTRALTGW